VALAARTVGKGDPTLDHSQSVHRPDARPLPGSLEETAELVTNEAREALRLRMDLTDRTSVEAAVATLLEEWGGADVVVNNGRHIGPGLMDTILDTPIDEYEKFLAAHGVNAIRIVQISCPACSMSRDVRHDRPAGTMFTPTQPAQQGGVIPATGSARRSAIVGSIVEHSASGIRAFNVEPGFVRTERNSVDATELGFDISFAAPPEAVGAAVAWLVSSPEADELMWGDVDAQGLAIERGLPRLALQPA
jgi:NAD(P)-dependent dehydrogenase (short-subunit alcohol dehydrogenase family)